MRMIRSIGGVPPRKLPWHLRYVTGERMASDVRRLAIMATHQHCTVRFETPVLLGPRFALNIPDQGSFLVGQCAAFRRGFYCEIQGDGCVQIGPHVTFTGDTMIQCSTSIVIGRRATLGQALMMADGNHRFRDHTRHLLDQGYDFRPLTIGDNAVIMTKSTVMADVGEGAVIGANSVVTKPIPAYCLAVGAPARVVEYFGPPELRPDLTSLAD
jgi:acetyltransferase-like isoleucine patch superfamily enzyme